MSFQWFSWFSCIFLISLDFLMIFHDVSWFLIIFNYFAWLCSDLLFRLCLLRSDLFFAFRLRSGLFRLVVPWSFRGRSGRSAGRSAIVPWSFRGRSGRSAFRFDCFCVLLRWNVILRSASWFFVICMISSWFYMILHDFTWFIFVMILMDFHGFSCFCYDVLMIFIYFNDFQSFSPELWWFVCFNSLSD